jgi:hypothetical protein
MPAPLSFAPSTGDGPEIKHQKFKQMQLLLET